MKVSPIGRTAPPPLGSDKDGGRTGSIPAEGTLAWVAWGGGTGGAAIGCIRRASPGRGLFAAPGESPPVLASAHPGAGAEGPPPDTDCPSTAGLAARGLSSLGRVFTGSPRRRTSATGRPSETGRQVSRGSAATRRTTGTLLARGGFRACSSADPRRRQGRGPTPRRLRLRHRDGAHRLHLHGVGDGHCAETCDPAGGQQGGRRPGGLCPQEELPSCEVETAVSSLAGDLEAARVDPARREHPRRALAIAIIGPLRVACQFLSLPRYESCKLLRLWIASTLEGSSPGTLISGCPRYPAECVRQQRPAGPDIQCPVSTAPTTASRFCLPCSPGRASGQSPSGRRSSASIPCLRKSR